MGVNDQREGVDAMRGILASLACLVVLVGLAIGLTRPAFDGGTLLAMGLVGLGGAALVRLAYGTRR